MSEIYWITRLDGIYNTFAFICTISSFVFVASLMGIFIGGGKECAGLKKALKISVAPIIISALILVFVPTTNEAMLIWGVGSSIDYLKENETAKQLPDKCIKALDAWVDSFNEEEK